MKGFAQSHISSFSCLVVSQGNKSQEEAEVWQQRRSPAMAFSIPWAPWNQTVTAEPKMACKSGPGTAAPPPQSQLLKPQVPGGADPQVQGPSPHGLSRGKETGREDGWSVATGAGTVVGPSPLPSKEGMPAQMHCCGVLQARHRTHERQPDSPGLQFPHPQNEVGEKVSCPPLWCW